LAGAQRPGMHSRASSRAYNVTSPTASSSPLEAALRRFSLSSSSSLPSAASSATVKMRSQYVSATNITAEVLGRALGEQGRQTQAVLEQVYAHSPYARVGLGNTELEEKVDELDGAIQDTVAKLGEAERGRHEDVKGLVGRVRKGVVEMR
jgi:hypothetical protein